MRLFGLLLILVLVHFQAQSKDQFVAEKQGAAKNQIQTGSPVGIPEIITFNHLMSLTPVQREQYLNKIAKALADFETATNQKYKGGRYAQIESLRDILSLYLELFPQSEAEDASTGTFERAEKIDGNCYEIFSHVNGRKLVPCSDVRQMKDSGQLVYDPDHKLDSPGREPEVNTNGAMQGGAKKALQAEPLSDDEKSAGETPPKGANPGSGQDLHPPQSEENDIPKNWDEAKTRGTQCKFDKATLDKARSEYTGAKGHNSDCMIGGIASTYTNGSPAEGRCKSQRQWKGQGDDLCAAKSAKAAGGSGNQTQKDDFLTLCNPMLFCSKDGTPICRRRAQNTTQQCFKAAGLDGLTEDQLKEKIKSGKTCVANISKEDWDNLRSSMKNLCSQPGSKVLFCIECQKLRYAIQGANAGAGRAPANSPGDGESPDAVPEKAPPQFPGPKTEI